MIETTKDLPAPANKLETKQDNSTSETSIFKLSDTLVIAAVPLIAYLILFVYETGYLISFGIPPQFISFDLAEVFVAIGSFLFFGFGAFTLIGFTYDIFLSLNISPVISSKISSYIPFLFLLLCDAFLFKFEWMEWYFFFFLLIVLLIADFVTPIFTQKRGKSYLSKIASSNEIAFRTYTKGQSFLSRIIRFIGGNRVKIIFYFILILYAAFRTGQSHAVNKKYYWVTNTNPEQAVIYIARNQAITAPFNRSTHVLEPEFRVIQFSDSPNVSFRNEKIGPLHLKSH